MKKTIKTSEILAAYNVLNSAKYGSMSDEDKIKVWKIARALKPVATKFKEDTEDAAEKLKPEVKGGYEETFMKAREFARMAEAKEDLSKAPMTEKEFEAFNKQYVDYQKLLINALNEFSEKEVEIEFEPLTDEAFGKLMASNEWTMGQAVALSEIICDNGETEDVEPKKDENKKK